MKLIIWEISSITGCLCDKIIAPSKKEALSNFEEDFFEKELVKKTIEYKNSFQLYEASVCDNGDYLVTERVFYKISVKNGIVSASKSGHWNRE